MTIRQNPFSKPALLGVAALFLAMFQSNAALPVTDGLILHLNSSSVVLDGSTVIELTDLSGSGNHALGTSGPTLAPGLAPGGQDVLTFNGVDQYLTIASNPGDFDGRGKTILAVFSPNSFGLKRVFTSGYGTLDVDNAGPASNSLDSIFASSTAGNGNMRAQNRNATGGSVGVSTAGGTVIAGEYYIGVNQWLASGDVFVRAINADNEVFVNSTTGGDANPGNHSRSRIGAAAALNASEFFDGNFVAVLYYNRELDASELASVEQYLHETYLIPEPSVIGLLLGGMAGLFVFLRRRSK